MCTVKENTQYHSSSSSMSGDLTKINENNNSKQIVGHDFVDVVEGKLSVEDATAQASSPASGAIALFVGTTRDHFEGKDVLHLEYEAYLPMAKKKMLETCQLVRSQWSVENIVMVHRIGLVPVMEASIIIAISAPHRKEALEAVHFAIDSVKATVPIWKKMYFLDFSF